MAGRRLLCLERPRGQVRHGHGVSRDNLRTYAAWPLFIGARWSRGEEPARVTDERSRPSYSGGSMSTDFPLAGIQSAASGRPAAARELHAPRNLPAGDVSDGHHPSVRRRLPHVVLEPEQGFKPVDLVELWRYRELIWLLASRDLKARYRQSLLGVAWSLMQPLFTLTVFWVFFALLGHAPTISGTPYVVSLLCGIVIWNFFSSVLASTASSLPANVHLISKVYCPRLVFPMANVIIGWADLAVSFVVLAAVLAFYRIVPGWQVLCLPLFVLMATLASLTIGLWIASLSIRWRDIRFVIPVLLQTGFYASPVTYETAAMIPGYLRTLYYVNPLAGVVEGCRWSLEAGPGFSWTMFALSAPLTLVMFLGSLYLFRRIERTLPDHL